MLDLRLLVMLSCIALSCKSPSANETAGSLEDVEWILVEAGGTSITTPPGGREVYMKLSHEGDKHMLKGFAGCNGLGGDYLHEGQTIKFQPITTKMYCELQMDVENMFTRILADTDRFRIEGNVLELYFGDQLLAKFESRR